MTNHTRQLSMHPWYDVGRPIAISLGLFCVLNFCWNVLLPSFGFYHTQSAPVILRRQGGIYLISSLVALPFLASALRRGVLSARDVGLGPDGWQAWRRMLGLGLAIALTTFLYLTLETKRTKDF